MKQFTNKELLLSVFSEHELKDLIKRLEMVGQKEVELWPEYEHADPTQFLGIVAKIGGTFYKVAEDMVEDGKCVVTEGEPCNCK